MSGPNDNIRVVIPLSIRRRNGRPKILPPVDVLEQPRRSQDPHIIKALGRAWAWRRKLESGEVATIGDLATLERVTDRFISRTMRLAYLSPDVIMRLLIAQEPTAVSCNDLVSATYQQWERQGVNLF
jgi:hypothetical protein